MLVVVTRSLLWNLTRTRSDRREERVEQWEDQDSWFPHKYGQNISPLTPGTGDLFSVDLLVVNFKILQAVWSWSLSQSRENIRKIKTKGGREDHLMISQQMWSSPEFNFTRARNREVRHKLSHKWTKLTLNTPLLSLLYINIKSMGLE